MLLELEQYRLYNSQVNDTYANDPKQVLAKMLYVWQRLVEVGGSSLGRKCLISDENAYDKIAVTSFGVKVLKHE
jgi:hypothetical protein